MPVARRLSPVPSPLLSPTRAAADAPDAIALVLPDRAVRYRQIPALVAAAAPRVAGLPFVACVAEPTLDTFVLEWTALEHGVPFVPLHPRLPAARRAELLADLDRSPPPRGTAAVVWTSGSTGAPRGVCLSSDNLVAAARASEANLGFEDDDRWLCALPLAHVGGLSIPVRCLLARRTVVAVPRLDAVTLREAIERHRATLASLVPAALSRLLAAGAAASLTRLRAILLGGDAASPTLLDACRTHGLAVLCTYGLTEAGGQVATQRPPGPDREPPAHDVGRPLPGVELRIAADGHIHLRGPAIAHAFVGEPPRDPAAWLDTGDLGHLDAAGRLHVDGRAKDVIVTGGETVHPAAIEAALSRCPGVEAALVCGLPDPTWGEIVCAALVARGAHPSNETVLADAAPRLASHELPRRVVWLDALPQTPTGKPSRAALRARLRPDGEPA